MDVNCIECGANIKIDAQLLPGEIITCSECKVELEVLNVNPVQLMLAPEIEEDWGE
jgi:alpha-aminoadipate/glutamate carrier protein LysW